MYYNIYIHTLCIYMLYSCPYLGAYSMMPLWCFFEVGKDRQLKLQPEPTSEVPSIMRWPGWQAKLGISADILQNLLMMAICWCFSHESIIKSTIGTLRWCWRFRSSANSKMWRAAESLLILQNKRKRLRKIIGRMQIKLRCTWSNQPKSFFLATFWPNGWFLWMVFAQKMGRFGRCRSCPSMRRSGRSPRVAWRGAQGPPKMIGAGTHNSPRWCWKHGKICFKQWISPWKNRS